MKRVIQIFILLLATAHGFSKCTSSGLHFWPEGATVNANSIFVVEGYATSQTIIKGLGTTHRAYLKSDSQTVNLKVQETLVGQYSLTQAILKPEETLTAGITYQLVIENLQSHNNEAQRYNFSTARMENINWTVTAQFDTVSPAWVIAPEFKNDSYQGFGCGPAVNAYFSFSAADNSEILIKTVVKNLATGTEATYYLKPDSNIIAVGHDMCSGAFSLHNSDLFEVEFSLFDASRNTRPPARDRIKFKRPT